MRYFFFFLLGIFLFPAFSSAAECGETWSFEHESFTDPVDIFTDDPLITTDCEDGKITATIGTNPNDTNLYIWKTIYHTTDGTNLSDNPLHLENNIDATGKWVVGQDIITFDAAEGISNYVAIYACRYTNNDWYCGCSDENNCSVSEENRYIWNLQKFGMPEAANDYTDDDNDQDDTDNNQGGDGDQDNQDDTDNNDQNDDDVEKTGGGVFGHLRTEGSQLLGENGNPVQLVGMSTNSIHWLPWGDCWTEESMDWLKSWGANVMRVAMHVRAEEGAYLSDKARFTADMERFIEEGIERNMYVLVDWHIIGLDPRDYQAEAIEFFEHIAQKYGDTGYIIYEPSNEPADMDWAGLKAYTEAVIAAIRQHDSDGLIVSATPAWSSFGNWGQASAPADVWNNPINEPNIMYAFHFYADGHRDEHLAVLDEASDNLPIFATEWGTQFWSGDGDNNREMSEKYITLMADKKISWTNWKFADHSQSGDVIQEGVCPNGPWQESSLKEAGVWAKGWIEQYGTRE